MTPWPAATANFAADRDEAGRLLEACPGLPALVRENRAFLGRAVTWAAGQGIAQFLDLGTGLPLRPAVHESARTVIPGARVAYVDNDAMVCSHVQALLATDKRVQGIAADLADPGAVLADPALQAVIDPGEPVCVILGLVLNLMPAARARKIVAGYARPGRARQPDGDLRAPGSTTASCGTRSAPRARLRSPRNHMRRTSRGLPGRPGPRPARPGGGAAMAGWLERHSPRAAWSRVRADRGRAQALSPDVSARAACNTGTYGRKSPAG